MQVKQLAESPDQENRQPSHISNMNYRPPRPAEGTMLLYYVDGDTRQSPSIAFVTHVEDRCIDVMVVAERANRLEPKHECYFVEDPWIREREDIRRFGGWDFHPDYYRIESLETRVELLEERLTNMETELVQKADRIQKTKPA